MSKDARKNKISSKGDIGKYDKGTKKDVEWHCEGHHVHKKKVNLNLCPYIKIIIGLKRHLQITITRDIEKVLGMSLD
jgi:hypothetical protein